MRKSQIESITDEELWNIVTDQAIEMGLLETFGMDDNKKNFKLENNDNLDLPNT